MNFSIGTHFTITCNICGQSKSFSPLDGSMRRFAADHAKCTIMENEKLYQIKMQIHNPKPSAWVNV